MKAGSFVSVTMRVCNWTSACGWATKPMPGCAVVVRPRQPPPRPVWVCLSIYLYEWAGVWTLSQRFQHRRPTTDPVADSGTVVPLVDPACHPPPHSRRFIGTAGPCSLVGSRLLRPVRLYACIALLYMPVYMCVCVCVHVTVRLRVVLSASQLFCCSSVPPMSSPFLLAGAAVRAELA